MLVIRSLPRWRQERRIRSAGASRISPRGPDRLAGRRGGRGHDDHQRGRPVLAGRRHDRRDRVRADQQLGPARRDPALTCVALPLAGGMPAECAIRIAVRSAGNLGEGTDGGRGQVADMTAVFAVDACRTPIGKIKGALAEVRPDHLAADVIKALLARNGGSTSAAIDDVYWGAANQAGEDNRNVARMARAAGRASRSRSPARPSTGSAAPGMEAVADAARAIAAGEADICLAGGAESMTRAPFVLPRASGAVPGRARSWPTPASAGGWSARDAGAVPADQPGRDGGERGRQVRRQPGAPGRVRAAQPPAGRRRPRRGAVRRRDRAGHRPGRARSPATRASRPG